MSNPLISNLLQTNVASTASRGPTAERSAPRDDSDTGQDFAAALGRRIGKESGMASEQANRWTPTADRNDEVQPRKSADSHDDSPRVARRPTHQTESTNSAQESNAPQGRSRPRAPSASEGEQSTDSAPSSSAPQSRPDDTNSAAHATKDGAANQAENTEAAAAATDNAASTAAPTATQLPADTAAAANLAALLQGLAAQLPAAQPPQPAASATTDGQPGTLPAGQGSSSHVLSTVLATLQRDGVGHMPMEAGGKDDTGVATGTAATANAGTGFAVPTKELAEPTAASRSAQTAELLRSASTEDSATNAATMPAPQSQLASADGQALGLQLANLTPAARSEAAHVPQLPVHTQAGQAAWADDVGNRVVWMLGRNESKAELVLTPAHLGKLEISIQVSGDQTTAHFVAATAAARDALEQALPRLREVMQQAGINLGQTNVSTSGDQRAQRDDRATTAGNTRGSSGDDVAALDEIRPATSSHWSRAALGMVDTFA